MNSRCLKAFSLMLAGLLAASCTIDEPPFSKIEEPPFSRGEWDPQPCDCKDYIANESFELGADYHQSEITLTEFGADGKLLRVVKDPFTFEKHIDGTYATDPYFLDTLFSEHSYRITVKEGNETVFQKTLDSIVVGERHVYRGCMCTITSYRVDGKPLHDDKLDLSGAKDHEE